MVDTYGRIHSGDWDTKQKSSTQLGAAPAIPTGEPATTDNNRWIKMTTTSGVSSDYKPHIKIEHTFKAGTDTTSTANLNTDNVASENASDKIDLYTPILDNMGHVVAKDTKTITLPYGFKTITPGSASTSTGNGGANTTSLVAENTQDTLIIAPSNKWIRVAGTVNTDTFTIGHQVNTIDTTASTATNLNDASTSTINIPDFTYDDAGHLTAKKGHDYTLPYNFKTVSIGNAIETEAVLAHANGNVVANSVYDTITLAEGNK